MQIKPIIKINNENQSMKHKLINQPQAQKQNQTIEQPKQGMSIIVKTVTRLTVGVLLLYGINVALHGHIIPGGGFAGGAIVALALLNVVLAFGKDAALEKLNHTWAIIFTTLGLLLFMLIGLFGNGSSALFENMGFPKSGIFSLFSAQAIPLLNIAVCLQVAAGIFAIFICLVSIDLPGDKQ
jgi:multicomponent Na+:H+ antiporter subunit B